MFRFRNYFIDAITLQSNRTSENDELSDRYIQNKESSQINEKFIVRLIPEIDSYILPPHFTRYVTVDANLIEPSFYTYTMRQNERTINEYEFSSSVIQGGYYSIPSNVDIFGESAELDNIGERNNIFANNLITEHPFIENYTNDLAVSNLGESPLTFSTIDKEKRVYLYGFNVGQGDSFLLITSSKNAYLVDMNIYNKRGNKNCKSYIDTIKDILVCHGIGYIKALIITHKHIDHIRGVNHFIQSSGIKIEHIIINLDYTHNTKYVCDMSKIASKMVDSHINANAPFEIKDGSTIIKFCNPTSKTARKCCVPDINDSSIVMKIIFGNTSFYLTGDAHHNVLMDCLAKTFNPNEVTFLKISHHGSSTGTNMKLINAVNPRYSFISAGSNKRYNHPHQSTKDMLYDCATNCILTKEINHDVCFIMDGTKIESKNI